MQATSMIVVPKTNLKRDIGLADCMGTSLDELRVGHYVKFWRSYWGIGMIPFSLRSTPRELDVLDEPATDSSVNGELAGLRRRWRSVVANRTSGKAYPLFALDGPIDLIQEAITN